MNIVIFDVKTITFSYIRPNILTDSRIQWYSFMVYSDCRVWIMTLHFGIYNHTQHLEWNLDK